MVRSLGEPTRSKEFIKKVLTISTLHNLSFKVEIVIISRYFVIKPLSNFYTITYTTYHLPGVTLFQPHKMCPQIALLVSCNAIKN